MKTRTEGANPNGDNKIAKGLRDPNLSKDGKWRSFPKVPNLLQYVITGSFYGRVKVDGKIYRESLDTTVYSVAKQKLPDFVTSRLRKKRQAGAPASFGEARKLYEQDLENDHALSESMKRYRRYCIKKLLGGWPGVDNLKLNRISAADCKEWAGRIATEIDEQYFNNTLGTLRAVLKRGGLVGMDDPTKDVKRLGIKPTELRLPEPDQFQKILEKIETSGAGQAKHCADLVRLLAYSGCRLSEARRVYWADVNQERGFITVHSAKKRKTANAPTTRNIPIIPEMRTLLERLTKEAHGSEDPVCKVGECEKSLTRACRLIAAPRITHHDLRHLFATRCIESGVDIPTVSRWLGHNDGGALAMKVYGHLRDSHSVEMGQKVRFAVGGKSKEDEAKGKYPFHWWESENPLEIFWGQANEEIPLVGREVFQKATERALDRTVTRQELESPQKLVNEFVERTAKITLMELVSKIPRVVAKVA